MGYYDGVKLNLEILNSHQILRIIVSAIDTDNSRYNCYCSSFQVRYFIIFIFVVATFNEISRRGAKVGLVLLKI